MVCLNLEVSARRSYRFQEWTLLKEKCTKPSPELQSREVPRSTRIFNFTTFWKWIPRVMQKRMLQPLSGSKITTIYNPSAVSSRRRTPKNKQKTYITWNKHVCSTSKIKNFEKKTCKKNPFTEAEPRGKKRIMNPPSKNDLFLKKQVL